MRLFRGILYTMMGLIAAAVLLTVLVVATPAGLRLALDVAEPWLPSALELPEVSGTLAGGVVVRDGAWRGGRVTVEVRELELELDPWPLLRRDIRLDRLRARGVAVRIAQAAAEADAEAPQEPGEPLRFRLPVALAIEDGRLEDVAVSGPGWSRSAASIELAADMRGSRLRAERLVVTSDWLGLDAAGEVRFEPRYPLRLNADWRYGSAEQGPVVAGSGRIEGDARGWAVTHRLAEPVEVRTEGTVELRESGLHARLRNGLGQLEVPLAGDRVLSVADGRVTLAGWLDGYTVEGTARLVTEGRPALQAEASGRGSLQRLELERLRLESEAGTLTAEGRLRLLPERRWELAYRLAGLETEPWGAPVAATVSANGRSEGRWSAAEGPRGTLTLADLAGTYRGEPLSGSGTIELGTDGGIDARTLEVTLGDNRVAADGRLWPAPDLALSIRAPRLAAFWSGLAGDLRGELELAGTRDAPVIRGELETTGIRRQNLALGRARLEASPAETGSRLRITAERLEAGGTVVESLRARAAGTPDSHDLSLTLTAAGATADVQAAGGLADSRWLGTLRALRIEQPKLGDWRLDEPAELVLAAGRAELARACLSGGDGGSLCVHGRTGDDGAQLAAEGRRLPLALLAPLFPAATVFEGEAQGGADLTWRSGVLDGRADLSVQDGRIAVMLAEDQQAGLDIRSFTARLDVDANEAGMEADLDLGAQGGAEATLRTADLFDAGAPLDGRLRLDFRDLSMVPLLVPELARVSGHVMGRVDIDGTRREPRLGGALRLREAGFLFPEAGIEVTELEVVARQEQPGLVDYQGSARSGEGRVRIRGTTRRTEEEGWVSRFTVKGQDFRIVRLPDMQATASPDLDIRLDDRRLEVQGRIEVPEADVTLREAGADAVRTSPDAVVHGRTEAGEARLGPVLFVEVQVNLGEQVRLKGFGLETGLTGSLRLTGGSRRPWLGFGRVSLVDASYSAYGQELDVERGELAFSGPLDNPALDIRAVRDAGEVVAGVQIGGTVRSPSSSVFSEPPLPEAEALAYLLTGRPLSGATSAEGNLLSRAALSLGLSQAGSVAARVSQEVGLDTLAVEGGADDGRVLAGKRLSEDLYLEYAWGIFDQIGTLLVRYDLSDRLRLESRSGEQHSVDLVYRVETD